MITRTPFTDLLAHYRTRARLSQSRLAQAAGFNHSYVSRLETGTRAPSRDAIATLARALDLGPEDRDRLHLSAGFAPTSDLLEPIRRPALRTRPAPGIDVTEAQLLNRLWRDHRDPADDQPDPGPTDLRLARPAEKIPEPQPTAKVQRPRPIRTTIRPLTDEELERQAERILARREQMRVQA